MADGEAQVHCMIENRFQSEVISLWNRYIFSVEFVADKLWLCDVIKGTRYDVSYITVLVFFLAKMWILQITNTNGHALWKYMTIWKTVDNNYKEDE